MVAVCSSQGVYLVLNPFLLSCKYSSFVRCRRFLLSCWILGMETLWRLTKTLGCTGSRANRFPLSLQRSCVLRSVQYIITYNSRNYVPSGQNRSSCSYQSLTELLGLLVQDSTACNLRVLKSTEMISLSAERFFPSDSKSSGKNLYLIFSRWCTTKAVHSRKNDGPAQQLYPALISSSMSCNFMR